jgi:GT2 family glycosyltransferase
MNLGRLRTIRERLADAVRRHGLPTVLKAIASSFLRYGLVATVRLGGAERPFPWTRKTGVQTQALSAQPSGPPDLDEAFALDLAQWRRWLALFAEQDSAAQDAAAVPVTVVVQGSDAESAARTREALAAQGAAVWRGGAAGPGPGGFWLFLQAGDLPEPDLLRTLTGAAQEGPAEVFSFDFWRRAGDRARPLLLPGANPTLLRSTDYLFSRLAVAADVIPAGADPQSLDPRGLVLGWLEGRTAHQVRARWRHLGRPLACIQLADDAVELARRQALEHGRRPLPRRRGEPISAVICTKDKGHLTRQLVGRLLDEDPALVGEVVIVANNTSNAYALQTLEDLAGCERVTVLRRDEPFNFSRLSNAGARRAAGRGPLLFLNDDIAPVSGDWLARLAARLEEPDTGAVGPLLLYPDERVQHAGMYLGKRGDAGHILRAASLPADDYLFTACAAREVSALTGAALLTPRAAFEALGGFDEQLATGLQDVDYCLRLRAIGLVNVFEPASVLIHMESATIRTIDAGQEFQRLRLAERTRFRERWGELLLNDPLHPRGFDLEDESLRRLAGAEGSRPKSR